MNEMFIDNNETLFKDRLLVHLQNSSELKIAVSYIRNSGLNPLIDEFKRFIEQDGKLQIIASAQMGITEKEAIQSLLEIGAKVCIVQEDDRQVFHAKGFIFKSEESSSVIIGSANLTYSGLFSGVEWGSEIIGNASFTEIVEREFDRLWNSQLQVTLETLDTVFSETTDKVISHVAEKEDGFSKNGPISLEDINKNHTVYSVHKRPDSLGSWNFNLSVKKVEKLFRTEKQFYVVFFCDYESPSEKIFAIPSDFLEKNIFPYAHKTRGSRLRYLININKNDLHFNWQWSVKMDGKPFLVKGGSQ